MKRLLVICLMLFTVPLAAQDETIRPNGTNNIDAGSNCTNDAGGQPAYLELDDAVDTTDDGECTPSTCTGSSRSDHDIVLDFATPGGNPSTNTDAQLIRGRASNCNGDGTDPTGELQARCSGVNIDSGWTATTLTGSTEVIWTESFTFNTTDCSADGSDLDIRLNCNPSGGSPANRRSCTWDSVEVEITYAAAGGSRYIVISMAGEPYGGGKVKAIHPSPGLRFADINAFGRGMDDDIRAWLRGGPQPTGTEIKLIEGKDG